jgi:hypothetical protein
MKSIYDPLLGRVKTRDDKVTERIVEYRGGGSGGGTAQALVIISAVEPASGVEGELYYNTVDGSLYIYVSGAWTAISGGTPAGGSFDYIDGTEFEFIDGSYFDFIV